MYERLQEELEAHSNEAIARAVERIDQCSIGTIHAFCSRLLRERPLEAGLPFDFKELDERDEPRARRKAWIAFHNQRLRAGDENLKRLLEIHFDSAKLFKFFSRRCQFPELDLKPTSSGEPDLALAVEKVRAFADLAYPHWTPELDSNPDSLADILSRARDFLGSRGVEAPHDQFKYLSFFDKSKITPTLKRWAADGWAKQAKDQLLPQLLEEAVHPALGVWKQYVYTLIVDIVDGAKEFYDDERRRAGVVTFEDLLIRTSELLRRNPEVRAYFGKRYKTILVDEFQDTDPVQAQVLMYLTSSDPTEDDWQRVVPRKGSLFVVGDEKQSIYRFRRADVETFRFVRSRIEETGGQIVHLNTSFRSLGNLCDWLNGSFGDVFSRDEEKYQSDYSELLRHRPDGRDQTCVRVIRHTRGGDVISEDAARIADFIKAASEGSTTLNFGGDGALVEDPVSLGDFMILTRTKKHLNSYARALEERGIPFDMVGGGELGRSEEVAALTQMFEAVLDPNDPVHLVGYLRGALVGFGDDELLAIKRETGRLDYRIPGISEQNEQNEQDEHAGLDDGLKRRLLTAYGRLK
ncbi:MAG: UvrD-helicase domain-containing protein, partial [Rhodothermia bacterium]